MTHCQQKEPGQASRGASDGGFREDGNQRAVRDIGLDERKSEGNGKLLRSLVRTMHA